jgi:SAM-dependent methyltransferase
MNWQSMRRAARHRSAAKYDAAEAAAYGRQQALGWLTAEDEAAYRADLQPLLELPPGSAVLDVGAGTGVMCSLLCRLPGIELTALEPSTAMSAQLTARPELANVNVINGFCDEPESRDQLPQAYFDALVARQVVNTLFDPLQAFRHWLHWLKPGGAAVVIDGLYGRDGWPSLWEEEVDVLPLSALQSLATVPYLLEASGFRVEHVQRMAAVNALPSTRTPRYVVLARRP